MPPVKTENKPVVAKEKAKVLSFVNFRIPKGKEGTVAFKDNHLKSKKGFTLLDNKYLTKEHRALHELAVENGGTAIVMVELRIQVAEEQADTCDISGIKLVAV
jgi:hypothetical protein